MDVELFRDPKKFFSIVLFVTPADLAEKRGEIERLGNQVNVRLVVQPCPYEGIEFLYRVGQALLGQHTSIDKEVYWQAIPLRTDTPEEARKEISVHHHQYLVAILEQDAGAVHREGKVLESLTKYYVAS